MVKYLVLVCSSNVFDGMVTKIRHTLPHSDTYQIKQEQDSVRTEEPRWFLGLWRGLVGVLLCNSSSAEGTWEPTLCSPVSCF